MGKYESINSDVYSIFATDTWKAEKIVTRPSNFVGLDKPTEFIRVSIIPSGTGLNRKSVSGIIIIDIFTQAGGGPKRSAVIADKLDSYLSGKSLSTNVGSIIQFPDSSALDLKGNDKDNPALYRVAYTIPFKYFEVL
jgi:hypothetical protein